MRIRSVRHKGLKRLILENDDRGIRADLVKRVRNILTMLIVADTSVIGGQGRDLERFGFRELANHVYRSR